MELRMELFNVEQVVPGELTIITGVPNSGKSEWIDALIVNLADRFGWRFGLCSMEKKVSRLQLCRCLHLVAAASLLVFGLALNCSFEGMNNLLAASDAA